MYVFAIIRFACVHLPVCMFEKTASGQSLLPVNNKCSCMQQFSHFHILNFSQYSLTKNSVYLSPVLFGLVTFTLWLYTILSQKIRSICMQDTSTLCPQSVCVCVSLGRLDCWFCPLKLSLVLFFCRRIGSKNTNIHINI